MKDNRITNLPKVSDLDDIFNASFTHASAHLNNVRQWEQLVAVKPTKAVPQNTGSKKIAKTRSNLEIKHVRKLMEWRYPVLEQAFLSRKELINPVGRDAYDMELAKFHKLILNYQFNNEIGKSSLISRSVRAYMNQGTVVAHLGWNAVKGKATYTAPTYKYDYVNATSPLHNQLEQKYIEVLAQIQEAPQSRSSIPVHLLEGAEYYQKHDVVASVSVTGFVEKTTEDEVFIHNHPVITIVNLHDVFAAPECSTNIQDSPYVTYRYRESIVNLKNNEDFDTDTVNWSAVGKSSPAPNGKADIYGETDERRLVTVYEYWGLHDIDGNGNYQNVKITWLEGHILECILNPFPDKKHPFYSAAYSPDSELQSFYGTADAYLVEDHQNILSAIHRGIIDIHANSAYGQRGYAKNSLDITNQTKFNNGEHFEYDPNSVSDPTSIFKVFDFPEISPSTMAYLQQINADSDALTGVKSYNEGISGSSLGNTAAGISGVLSATAMRESSIIGRLENMFVDITKRIMQLNILYLDSEKIVQLAGMEGLAIKTHPNPLIDIELDITNQSEDALQAQEISFMLQTLGNTLPLELTKQALMEVCDLRNLQRFYHILSEFDATPPPPSPAETRIQELEIELLEAKIANENAIAKANAAKGDLHASQANTELNVADKTKAETDQIIANTEYRTSGQETEDKIRVISAQGESNMSAHLVKMEASKGMSRKPS